MAQQTINVGTIANDGTGDPLRTAFQKSNSNFTELYGVAAGLGDAATKNVGTAAGTVAAGDHTHAYSEITGTPTLGDAAALDVGTTAGTVAAGNHTHAYGEITGTPTLGDSAALNVGTTAGTVAAGNHTHAYGDITGTPTLGTAAALNVGTAAGNVVQLDGSARLPAVDGSQLTGLPSGVSDHGALTGLADDDHTQYHTDARGDARYSLLGHTHSNATTSVAGFLSAADKTKLDGVEAGADVTDAANVDAAGAVMESDYNANTILAATADNTPAPLTVGEATIVGRQTGGAISAIARVSAGEITAGTETALRAFSPSDVAGMAAVHGGGGGGAGGGWTLIQAQEVTSAQSAVTFDSVFSSTYDHYLVTYYDVKCSVSGNNLNLWWRNGTTDVNSATTGIAHLFYGGAIYSEGNSNASGYGHKLSYFGRTLTGTNASVEGFALLRPRIDAPKYVNFDTHYVETTSGPVPSILRGYSFMSDNTAMSGCKINFYSGNITQGRFAVYGLPKS